ncbi:MAG: hypothetical protein FWB88_07900 [Defluviitaleaceae bacterium]|nr:hypothetical protein [Defluviitaleaceae bacterium]MCL2240119.1 hypothetical protein [Defluviitaleaceae bacterium]
MQKTKLGISVGLFAAAIYFVGLTTMTPLLLIAGYVFVVEEDLWLKKAAIRAVGIVLFFAILSSLLAMASNSTSLVNNFILLFRQSVNLTDVNRVITITQTLLNIVERLILLVLGFKALKQRTIGLGSVDKTIDANM